jgi:hypothetical protein
MAAGAERSLIRLYRPDRESPIGAGPPVALGER